MSPKFKQIYENSVIHGQLAEINLLYEKCQEGFNSGDLVLKDNLLKLKGLLTNFKAKGYYNKINTREIKTLFDKQVS